MAHKAKAKINKWDNIKLKHFCAAKETINKTKKQPTEREEMSVNHVSDKGLIYKIHKNSYDSRAKSRTIQQKWVEELNRHFSKEDIQMANR